MRQYLPRSYSLLAYTLFATTVGRTLSWTASGSFSKSVGCRTHTLLRTTRTITMATTTDAANNNDNDVSNQQGSSCPLETLGLPAPLILGSASFTRKLILKEMNIPYHIVIRPIDEKNLGDRSQDPPKDLVLKLGKAKADHLVQEIQAGRCREDLPLAVAKDNNNNNKGMIVLTGDQVVTCAGKILEKPESVQEAKQFVSQYPTNPPSTVGSVVLTHVPSGIQISGWDTATVHFRNNFSGDELVDSLLEEGAPVLSCAGGLMVEHPKVKQNIERIDGTEDSVMGLSKDLVLRLLNEMANKLQEANLL